MNEGGEITKIFVANIDTWIYAEQGEIVIIKKTGTDDHLENWYQQKTEKGTYEYNEKYVIIVVWR